MSGKRNERENLLGPEKGLGLETQSEHNFKYFICLQSAINPSSLMFLVRLLTYTTIIMVSMVDERLWQLPISIFILTTSFVSLWKIRTTS